LGGERKSFRDRIRDKITRITKKYGYVVERSREPDGNKEYLVVYECETERGCNYQRVFKGPLKDCKELAKRLNNANNKEVKKDEQN
jgi:hypothetical protein